MAIRPYRRKLHGPFLNALESRNLPSAGLAGVADVLRELGPVSRSAATSGVEATAAIDSGDSVTLRFEIEATGDYTLLVRHTGDGLTLEANGPGGSATINPGSAGPFQVVPLHLNSATYEVTASARSGQPIFVDWELLLNTGVSQSAATAPGTLLPSLAIPSPASTPAPALAMPSGANISAHFDASHSLLSSVSSPLPTSTWSISSGPVGHPTLQPTLSPEIAFQTPRPTGPPWVESLSPLDVTLLEALQPQAGDRVALIEIPWWDRLFEATSNEPMSDPVEATPTSEPALTPRLADGLETPPSAPTKNRVSLSMISPGLFLGAIAVTVASRARLGGNRESFHRKPVPREPIASRLDLHLEQR